MWFAASVIIDHTEESPEFHDGLRLRILSNRLDSLLWRFVAGGVDKISQKGNLRPTNGALSGIYSKSVTTQLLENGAQVLQMLLV